MPHRLMLFFFIVLCPSRTYHARREVSSVERKEGVIDGGSKSGSWNGRRTYILKFEKFHVLPLDLVGLGLLEIFWIKERENVHFLL